MFCRLHQFRVSAAIDEDADLPKSTLRHLERCARCREFRRRGVELAGLLRTGACELPAPALAGVRKLWVRWVIPAAAAAVLVVAVAATWTLVVGPTPTAPTAEAPSGNVPAIPAALLAPAQAMGPPLALLDRESAGLSREVECTTRDIRIAAEAAMSFLPAPTRRTGGDL